MGNENPTVAIALGEAGREIFLSLDGRGFVKVAHFPRSISEARLLLKGGGGPTFSHEQLIATHREGVALVPIRNSKP